MKLTIYLSIVQSRNVASFGFVVVVVGETESLSVVTAAA